MNFDPELLALAKQCVDENRKAGRFATTAESCTGGLVSAALTEIAGASDMFGCSFVTYSNRAKMALLDVPGELLKAHGAVSEPVARAMAAGALAKSGASVAVAISGVAGPGGGSAAKPVGTVAFACAVRGVPGGEGATITAETRHFGDLGRAEVRRQAALVALRMLLP